MNEFTINVYMDDGLVYSYGVNTQESAREHSFAIVQTGYRHVSEGYLVHFPPHRISKVKVVGNIQTNYPDTVSGT